MKDENKQTKTLSEPVLFDQRLIRRITFDLIHINEGWDDLKHDYAYRSRSSYTAADIVDFFEQLKYYRIVWMFGINKNLVKKKGISYHRYYWETSDIEGETVRVLLDLPLKITDEGIIVTVFKT